ncbi:hypothetical protein LB467_04810 [Salegentibacter sp. JZCK2]|uniref:hypothetical protein n=1 Tax=Salegentibacter tibetensis TaxID=2873600 RepID=UPI001CC93A95|nr:hypothetical protein [Salegentibacter tibetensis]MBZ9728998.1 hypothetical protein [Salegentibacter tibetensis]
MKSISSFAALLLLFLNSAVLAQTDTTDQIEDPEKKGELTYETQSGLPVAASKIYFSDKKFTISGFGEAGYTEYFGGKDRSSEDLELYMNELYRFVTYLAYKPKPWLILYGEVFAEMYRDQETNERDHEIFFEVFADFLIDEKFNLRAGTHQVQIGYMNTNDEPILYHSVNRSPVERLITPSTWIDLGVMAYGKLTNKLDYSLSIYQGLDTQNFNGGTWIRRGRDNGLRGNFDGYVLNGKLGYQITKDTEFVVNGVWTQAGNNQRVISGNSAKRLSANTFLTTSYLRHQWNSLSIMALGSYGRMGQTDLIFDLTKQMGTGGQEMAGQVLGSEVFGYYLELGYDILPMLRGGKSDGSLDNFLFKGNEFKLPLFLRYDRLDTHSEVVDQLENETRFQTNLKALTLGLNFNPRRNIVFKANYMFRNNSSPIVGTNDFEGDRFEFGVGFIF